MKVFWDYVFEHILEVVSLGAITGIVLLTTAALLVVLGAPCY